jgi:hypothetical protein
MDEIEFGMLNINQKFEYQGQEWEKISNTQAQVVENPCMSPRKRIFDPDVLVYYWNDPIPEPLSAYEMAMLAVDFGAATEMLINPGMSYEEAHRISLEDYKEFNQLK